MTFMQQQSGRLAGSQIHGNAYAIVNVIPLCHHVISQLSVIKLVSHTQNFINKTQSEARLDGKAILVHVTAEVMSLEMRFETRKSVTPS